MRKTNVFGLPAAGLLFCTFLFSSCEKEMLEPADQRQLSALQEAARKEASSSFYGLTADNMLVAYGAGNTARETGAVMITGLQSGEKILAIDFRPATGQLYGVSNQSRLYVLNQNTGRATQMGTQPFSPAIDGMHVGFDFNPTVDRIRLVTDKGQNLRLHPETGMVAATDGSLKPGNPAVTAVAYTNSMAGATSTALYDIDTRTDMLYLQSPPNDGVLVEVGRLNVQAEGEGGFDISPDNSLAIAVLYGRGGGTEKQKEESEGNKYRFYSIDLKTGKAQNMGKTNRMIIGVAIPTNPVAYATDASNKLLIFNPYKAETVISKTIAGLQDGEKVVGLDMRPATSQLYALTSASRIYTVNLASGAFSAVGTFSPALEGTFFGFDFNPLVDRIRVVSNTGQNLRLNPNNIATAIVDGRLNPGSPMVDASAYTNNFVGTTSTSLYNLDFTSNALHLQSPPNEGDQVVVGSLGVDIEAHNGFDIAGTSGTAYALLRAGTQSGVYKINLSTGRATMVSAIPGSTQSFAVGLGL